jgi:hypothetical protein
MEPVVGFSRLADEIAMPGCHPAFHITVLANVGAMGLPAGPRFGARPNKQDPEPPARSSLPAIPSGAIGSVRGDQKEWGSGQCMSGLWARGRGGGGRLHDIPARLRRLTLKLKTEKLRLLAVWFGNSNYNVSSPEKRSRNMVA